MLIRKLYNLTLSADKQLASYVKGITGIIPNNLKIYKQVFQHRSKFNEPRENNERLELLGDSILDGIVCAHLYKKYPYKEEGFITELRAKIVNRKSLNEVGTRLGLLEQLKFNRRGMKDVSKDLAGNTFEALVGAVYLDAGYMATQKFIQKRILKNLIDVDELQQTTSDYKSIIYHYVQREAKTIEFKVMDEKARNKRAYFTVHLEINGQVVATGEGFNKKSAEQSAAMNAINLLCIDVSKEREE